MMFIYLWLVQVASAMLGPMEKEDVFMAACTGALGMQYIFGSETCRLVKDYERPDCSCPDTRFAQSVSVCIDSMVRECAKNADQVDEKVNSSFMAFTEKCPEYTMADLREFLRNGTNIPVYDQSKKSGLPSGKWPVESAFRLRDIDLFNAYATQIKSASAEMTHKWFGAGLLFYWLAILSAKSAVYVFNSMFPLLAIHIANSGPSRWIRRYLLLRPNKYLQLGGMTQLQAVIIFIFWALTFIFTYAGLLTSFPTFNYLNNRTYMYSSLIGQRSGDIPMYMIPLLVLFGGRNNILQWATGWSFGTFIAFHKWIARAVLVLLIEHSIAYSIQASVTGRYGEMWTHGYWYWGLFGTLASGFLVIHSVRFLKNPAYDLFVVLHIAGVISFILTGYYHLKLLDDPYGLYFYWASIALWGLDRALRLLRVVSSGIHRNATIELHRDMLVVTTRKPSFLGPIGAPGKYVFIHFWRPNLFWQSHPFTIVEDPRNPENLKLFCKIYNGATRQIAKYVLATQEEESGSEYQGDSISSEKSAVVSTREVPQISLPILLDGLYGQAHDLVEFSKCVFIAGGSGITAPLSYIQHLLETAANSKQTLHLFWAVKDAEHVESIFSDELEYLTKHSYKLSVTICSSKSGSRLDIKQVVHNEILNSCGPVSVMCCGPTSMCMAAREAVCDSLNYTKEYVDYFEELFNW